MDLTLCYTMELVTIKANLNVDWTIINCSRILPSLNLLIELVTLGLDESEEC